MATADVHRAVGNPGIVEHRTKEVLVLNPDSRPLISVRRAAERLGITESSAYRWLAAGELPGAVRVNGRSYVRRRVLEARLHGEEIPRPLDAA
ncbi:MAG: helix-turn-helix domain-containing protein [Chloroflexi bacterium]|nr:helix-turn-helix domain-containing protein [Chloroflexota bacterium]